MPGRTRSIGAVAASLIALGVLLPGASTPSMAAPAPTSATVASAGAAWLAGEMQNGAVDNGGGPDWGLTEDAVFAFAANGLGATAGAATADRLAQDSAAVISPGGGSQRIAGLIAKLLVVAVVQGRNPAAFGGLDLRSELLATMSTAADSNLGRFRDVGPTDGSNGFTQSFGVLGLARTGTVPPDAISFLLQQQCPEGGFRLFYPTGGSCTVAARGDVDTTALAVQALAAAAVAGVAGTAQPIAAALDWLVAQQHTDGSFGGSGPTSGANANSSALAAQALYGAGRSSAADLTAAYLRSLQLGCAFNGPAADRGAIAYDPTVAGASTAGIDPSDRDQFRRATSQAVIGLGAPSLATLSASTVVTPAPPSTCVEPTTTTAATTTTTTIASPTSTTTTTTIVAGSTTTTAVTTSVPGTTTTTTAPPATTTTIAPITTLASQTIPVAVDAAATSRPAPLAATGLDVVRRLLLAIGIVMMGAFLLAERRRRDR